MPLHNKKNKDLDFPNLAESETIMGYLKARFPNVEFCVISFKLDDDKLISTSSFSSVCPDKLEDVLFDVIARIAS